MRSADIGSSVPGAHALPQRLTHITSHSASVSGHRTLEELLTALRKGADLLKHGRLGKPKMHFFRLADADTHLMWRSSNGKQRSIALASVFQVVPGQTSENFRRHPLPNLAQASFSMLYTDTDQSVRTLDLTCRSQQEYELWYWGLNAVTEQQAAVSLAAGSKPAAAFALMASAAKPALREVRARSMSGPPQAPELTPSPSTKNAIGGGTVQGRITGAMGVPVPEHRPGDCYVWGSCEARSNGSSAPSPVCSSAVACSPLLVSNSSHLDVSEASVGRQHAVLVTRGGELFTWGSGHGGKLGLGHMMDAHSPQRVHTLWGQSIKHVAAGDYCTAAVSEEGSLYTWGDGAAQNLGYADALRQVIPRRVDFGSVQRVLQVSCGPYHSAAVVSSGALFTWGDGLCGKLGHGNQQSICGPRQVEGLTGCRVLHVACGVWHTAAVAAHVPGFDSLQQGSTEVDPAEWEAIQQKMANAYDVLDEEGGQLYTWGGAFEDSATKSMPLTPRLPAQQDNHQGCLGHGNKAGRLTPTRVAGALECLGVRQVECGLNLTVALTVDGRVWQMGETGAASDKRPSWERALAPVQVPLSGCYVGRIAVGMHHAAALAELLDQQSPASQAREQTCIIFTWGRGREGQLGTGAHADSAVPQPVEDLQGRQVLQVACGGYHTLAVCRHDAEREDTEERRRGYKGKMRMWFANTNASLDLAATRSASEPFGGGKTPVLASSQQAEDSSSAYDSSSPSAGAAEVRSTARIPRKSALKRGSFMGIRAPLALANVANQIRRHSGDAYGTSHKLLSGLKSPSLSGSETSRLETSSEGPGDFGADPGTERRAASGSEEANLLRGPVPLQSRPNPERRLREQQFTQEAQSTQLLQWPGDAGTASKASAQHHLESDACVEVDGADAAEQPSAAMPLSRYLSISQQVALALSASRAQLPKMDPPALPKHLGQVPEQEQCIQELRDRVAYLEQMVAESGSAHAQPATLHTGLPAVPSPSPHKDLALNSSCITPSGARRAPGGTREGSVSGQSPPPRRVLSLSPERPPLSAASPGHRSSASRSLTLDGVSAAPLWQVDAPEQYAYAEPGQQSTARPRIAQQAAAEQSVSLQAQRTLKGSCSSTTTNYGSPAAAARQSEPEAATPQSSTRSESMSCSPIALFPDLDAAAPPSPDTASSPPLTAAQHLESALTPCSGVPRSEDGHPSSAQLPEPAASPHSSRSAEIAVANPYSHGFPSTGPVSSPLRMNTIDVGALMGHSDPCSQQQESRQRRPWSGRPVSRPPSRFPCKSTSGAESSAAGEMAAAADETEAERMELLTLRRQLRERERRLHEREQHLHSQEAVIQATCTRIMFPGEPLQRRGAAHSPGTAAQPGSTIGSQRGHSHPPQQSTPAEEKRGQVPAAAAQRVRGSAANEGVKLPPPTSTPQVQLLEQGIATLPSPRCTGQSTCARGQACQVTAMPQDMQPEEQLAHGSADAVSLALSAHDSKELCDQVMAPQQQEEDRHHSKVKDVDTARTADKPQELEPHLSNASAAHLLGSEEEQREVSSHSFNVSVSPARSYSSTSGSAFYSPTASDAGSEDSIGRFKKSFSFHKPGAFKGPLRAQEAASHPDGDQTEMLHGYDAPGQEAPPAAACAEPTAQSPLFGVATAFPAGGAPAPQSAGACSAAAGSVMYQRMDIRARQAQKGRLAAIQPEAFER